jgi:hypothetical protein
MRAFFQIAGIRVIIFCVRSNELLTFLSEVFTLTSEAFIIKV